MNVFISGGCKNGKSMFAQHMTRDMAESSGKKMYYVATMIPTDDEDRARILRHIDERDGWGYETIEIGRNICDCLDREGVDAEGVFLLDSVTALLSNEMFLPDGTCNFQAGEKVARELLEFGRRTGNTVFVSDYIYSDARLFDQYTENYKEALAYVDKTLAKACDQVVEVAYGHTHFYK